MFNVTSTSRSKERRLHLLETGQLADCEFLAVLDCSADVADSDYDSHSEQDDGDDDDDDANSSSSTSTKTTNEYNTANHKRRRFRCHKMVLATASEVFERMFFGELSDCLICVSDVTPHSFSIFLKYVYTYDLDATEVQLQEAPYLLNLGNKYMMDDFTDACVQVLIGKNWPLADIFPMFDMACLYENLTLMLRCYECIQANANQLLTHRSFYNLNVNCLKRLMVLLSSHPTKMHCTRLLLALEKYGLWNNLEVGMERFQTLREAAMVLNFSNLTPAQLELGPARSYLLNNKNN